MRASLLLNALVALGVLGLLALGPSDSRAAFELVRATGALSLSNSKEGAAILSGHGLRPGSQTSGSVTIGNPGSANAELALEAAAESETAGAGGARLWERLWISVSDGSRVVYEGRVAGLGRLGLGALPAGAQRSYTITASLPNGDNALQGARVSLRFTWLAQADAVATPTPPVSTPEPTPPEPTPAPPASPPVSITPDPSATLTAEQILSLPSAKKCVRTIQIKVRSGVSVKSVTAKVNGRKRGSGKTTLTLRGLPRGTVRVQVTATLTSGRKVTLKRTYRTCK